MVTLGQLFLVAQFGLPGAFTIVGLGPLKFGKPQDIIFLVVKRFLPFAIISVLLMKIYHLDLQLTILILVGYLILIPSQWVASAFQPHVSNLEFAGWRILPSLVQLVCIAFSYFSLQILDLHILVFSWLLATVVIAALTIIRLKRIVKRLNNIAVRDTLERVRVLSRSGFVAHIGVADIIRLETYLIPLVNPAYNSAKYFAVAGLANWSRVLVDGLSVSIFQKYTQLSFHAARELAMKRVIVVATFGISLLFVILPISNQLLRFAVGSKYESVFNLFFTLSATLLFSSLRRMYLDAFRTHGQSNTSFASKIEIQSWGISIPPILLLFTGRSLEIWAWSTCFSNLFALCFVIYRGQRWISVEN